MITNKATIEKALDIFKILLTKHEISREDDRDLYEDFLYNSEVEEILNLMAEKLELDIYCYNEKIFLTPGVNNKLFGYTHEDLRKAIPYVTRNSELFMAYFIILVIITLFYKQSGVDTNRGYVNITEIVESATQKLDALVEVENLETVSSEYSFNFADIAKLWENKSFAKQTKFGEISNMASTTKMGFVHGVCNFLQSHKIIKIVEEQGLVVATNRFKGIIYNFFEDKENKSKLLTFVEDLGK
jgi:hypothetical protein